MTLPTRTRMADLYCFVRRLQFRDARITEHPTGHLVVEGWLFDHEYDKALSIPVSEELEQVLHKLHRRTSGEVLCDACGQPYRKHPRHYPWVHEHVACNGDILHL